MDFNSAVNIFPMSSRQNKDYKLAFLYFGQNSIIADTISPLAAAVGCQPFSM